MATRTFYRKHYTGFTSGLTVRAASVPVVYPEACIRDYVTLEALAKDHGTQQDERYELVREETAILRDHEVESLVVEGLALLKDREERRQRVADTKEFERLKAKLGKGA